MDDYNLLPCGVFVIDAIGKIQYCNDTFASMLGCSVAECSGHSVDDFLTKASQIIFQQIVLPTVLNQKEIHEVQINFIDNDNNKLPMIIFAKDNKRVDGKLIFCCFSAKERQKMLSSINDTKNQLEAANAKLKMLSTMDELTGCLNRRELKNKMAMVRRQMSRRELHFAVLMLDLDNFKQLNDTYGHVEGDYVLKQFASLLMEFARFDDVVARYGGEEFLIVLPDVDEKSALIASDRVHENMKKIRTKSKKVTVSIGVCVVAGVDESSDKQIIEVADKALYESKRTGKNKTTLLQLE